ncbi:nuclear transport factor 2 family protein [Candidatus Bipolaricaulota bacterium]
MSDLDRIRQLIEDVYVRDMYVVRERETLSSEFHKCFCVLLPQLDGRTGLCETITWEGPESLRGSNPKALETDTRFEFPLIDITGDAAITKVVIHSNGQPVYTDYVSLYRVDGEWKIVSKLFHSHLRDSTSY